MHGSEVLAKELNRDIQAEVPRDNIEDKLLSKLEERKNTVQLKDRYWNITDAKNNTEEIRGPGVVGNQPIIKPGESYEYNSFCPLKTEFGVMHGHFGMKTSNGRRFNAKVNPFRFAIPFSVN